MDENEVKGADMEKEWETTILYFTYKKLENDPFWMSIMNRNNALDVCNFYLHIAALSRIGFIDYQKIIETDSKKITDFLNLHPDKKQIDVFLCNLAN